MKRISLSSMIIGILIGATLFGGLFVAASGILAEPSDWRFFADGEPVDVEAYNIAGSNYMKVRDVLALVDVGVWFDGEIKEAYIERDRGYDPNYQGPTERSASPSPSPNPSPSPSSSPSPSISPSPSPSPSQPHGDNTLLWIPRTGSKYHSYSTCSGMSNPTQVTRAEAVSRGYSACSRCW